MFGWFKRVKALEARVAQLEQAARDAAFAAKANAFVASLRPFQQEMQRYAECLDDIVRTRRPRLRRWLPPLFRRQNRPRKALHADADLLALAAMAKRV